MSNLSEQAVQNAVRAEAQRIGIYLWRNNNGVLQDARGVPVRFGLANDSAKLNKVFKSSDLIGITATGRFIAVECKPEGWLGVRTEHERAQENFINVVRGQGGIAGFVRSLQEFRRLLLDSGYAIC